MRCPWCIHGTVRVLVPTPYGRDEVEHAACSECSGSGELPELVVWTGGGRSGGCFGRDNDGEEETDGDDCDGEVSEDVHLDPGA